MVGPAKYPAYIVSEKVIWAQVEVRSNRGRDREESRLKRLNRPDPRCGKLVEAKISK